MGALVGWMKWVSTHTRTHTQTGDNDRKEEWYETEEKDPNVIKTWRSVCASYVLANPARRYRISCTSNIQQCLWPHKKKKSTKSNKNTFFFTTKKRDRTYTKFEKVNEMSPLRDKWRYFSSKTLYWHGGLKQERARMRGPKLWATWTLRVYSFGP